MEWDNIPKETGERWNFLHRWAEKFRKEHDITVYQFLKFFNLPTTDVFQLYLYPDKYNSVFKPRKGSVAEELLEGLTDAFYSVRTMAFREFEKVDELTYLCDKYEMNRARLRKENIECCFLELIDGKIQIECLYAKEMPFDKAKAQSLLIDLFGICDIEFSETELC